MDVKTADDAEWSLSTVLVYAAGTAVIVGVVLLPTLVPSPYAKLLNTLLLVLLLGLVGRTYLGTILSFVSLAGPDVDPTAERPTVSVVIPAYNEEPVLAETIEACQRLDYPAEKLEIVVCYEAASTDATAEVAKRAAANDPRVVAVERDEPGGGKAMATNFALGYATGDVIASIDADHQFKPDAVERAVRWFLADEDIWCVKGRCYGRNPTDSLLALHATVERHIAELADLYARQVFGGFTIFGGGQAFFRAELFRELGEFDETVLVEDIDMSAKIHAHEKKLRVDPNVVTYEENPATFAAWWSQRKRWARGWMQVATRYLPTLPRDRTLSFRTRLDVTYTFSYAVVPVFFVIAAPMFVLGWLGVDTSVYLPAPGVLWQAIGVAPVVTSWLIFARDGLVGNPHHPWEYLAAITLWPYLFFQSVVYMVAFLDEFVFDADSVYVTTSRAENRSRD